MSNYLVTGRPYREEGAGVVMSDLACLYRHSLALDRKPAFCKDDLNIASQEWKAYDIDFVDVFPNVSKFFEVFETRGQLIDFIGHQPTFISTDLQRLTLHDLSQMYNDNTIVDNAGGLLKDKKLISWFYLLHEALIQPESPKVQELFQFKSSLDEECDSIIEKNKGDVTVGLSLRLEYLSRHTERHVCNPKWWEDAVQIVQEKVGQDKKFKFLIFADYPDKVGGFLSDSEYFKKADKYLMKPRNAVEGMCLLSKCDHQIVSNTSFGFWGAALNKSSKKIVVVPSTFHVSWPYSDLYNGTWGADGWNYL